ncbi:MAG: hypothetical protein ACT4NJ_02285 [Nitrosopumilaceae archaeon]
MKRVSKRKWDLKRIGKDLANYIDAFEGFSDDAAPAPEVEIKVKGTPLEFYNKYLDKETYFLLYATSDALHVHCKPRHLTSLLKNTDVEYMDIVPGIYEPM